MKKYHDKSLNKNFFLSHCKEHDLKETLIVVNDEIIANIFICASCLEYIENNKNEI